MVEGQIDDLSVVDSDGEDRVLGVFVGDLEDIGAFGRQHDEVSGVGSLFLKLGLLGSDGNA